MKRYLIYFSYLGTRFRGSQKQFNKGIPVCPTETVQSLLEFGLSQLKPINQPVVYPASRTDQGVHALCTAAHVDLVFFNDHSIYSIIKLLNTFFTKHDFDIRVLSVREVPNSFSARHSVLRKKYLYRFAVVNSHALPELPIKRTSSRSPYWRRTAATSSLARNSMLSLLLKLLPYSSAPKTSGRSWADLPTNPTTSGQKGVLRAVSFEKVFPCCQHQKVPVLIFTR
uniref:tRNA pseudouridine synthase A n=1 Tax=Lygus hesperus TaxID=30085 RepID=A0A0A9ZDQ7_LYGHE